MHWLWACAAYAPVSQVFPFLFAMGDRYLYTVLPGLLAGSALALDAATRHLAAREERAWLGAACALPFAALFFFAAQERAPLWKTEGRLLRDAASNYPAGRTARFFEARRLTAAGELDAAYEVLAGLGREGFTNYEVLVRDRGLQPLRAHPDHAELLAVLVGNWLEKAGPPRSQIEFLTRARAHLALGDVEHARRDLQRAVERGGPWQRRAEAELRRTRVEAP